MSNNIKLLSVGDVADQLGVHRDTVLRWIKAGKLPASYLGGSAGYRIHPAELRRFLEERYGSRRAAS